MNADKEAGRYFVMVNDGGYLKPLINSMEEVAIFESESHASRHAERYCNGRVTFEVFRSAT